MVEQFRDAVTRVLGEKTSIKLWGERNRRVLGGGVSR